jgi:DNA-binding transcriptional LysR family regulator
MKDISALKLYSRVARLGSFSAAAREVGLSQPQASRTIAELEAELGVRLLTRSTRAVVTTEAGTEFLTRIEPILLALEEAEQSVREGCEFRGQLRLSTATSFGVHDLIPHLTAFAAKHPALHIQVQLGDSRQDLVRDAVDVAFRLGRLIDSVATARQIAAVPRVVVASPGYVERHGAPADPNDLHRHRIVAGAASAVPTAWRFSRDGEEVAVELDSHFSTNENEAAVAAAVAGLGITSTSGWACRRELREGRLVMLLGDWSLPSIPVHAYFPMGRATRAAARALVEHLATEFRLAQDAPFP